jgi:asparagine synthase (glutamine-hydrolysing)
MQAPGLELKLSKLAKALRASSGQEFYRSLRSHWKVPERMILGVSEQREHGGSVDRFSDLPGLREQMMLLDMLTYLPDDILTKVDRASMAVSLEARVPLLDHRLVEFAWQVPTEFKVRDGQGKWLFRKVLDRYVPRSLMERPKQGFGIPIEHWLRGPLRDWAESLLEERRLVNEGFFDPAPIRKAWTQHLAGQGQNHHNLWCVLMFQAWLDEQRST